VVDIKPEFNEELTAAADDLLVKFAPAHRHRRSSWLIRPMKTAAWFVEIYDIHRAECADNGVAGDTAIARSW
jgi:hypothetical protein